MWRLSLRHSLHYPNSRVVRRTNSLTDTTDEVLAQPVETAISVDLLDVVTEVQPETGYETAELDPTLMLEADLRIDTVKQAEVMGILREKIELSQDSHLTYLSYRRLRACILSYNPLGD